MRVVLALSQELVEFKSQTSAPCGLIIQWLFSFLCTEGDKRKELGKVRVPPSKTNLTFFMLESATTTTFQVHDEVASKVGARCPKCVIDTVYLEGSYYNSTS